MRSLLLERSVVDSHSSADAVVAATEVLEEEENVSVERRKRVEGRDDEAEVNWLAVCSSMWVAAS